MTDLLRQIILPVLFLLFLAATLVQLLCWLGVFARFARILAQEQTIPDTIGHSAAERILLPVSVVVCARNEAENLRRHLPLWLNQQYAGDWELLIVDDASDDDTLALLHQFQSQHPRLRGTAAAGKKIAG